MKALASIDIGSNALRLLIARPGARATMQILRTERAPVRLGTDVFSDGRISLLTARKLTLALQDFQRIIRREDAELIRAVGTSALRDARNREDILASLARDTRVRIDVISGEEEANLVFQAVQHKLKLKRGRQVLIDIGGGSVEISLVQHGVLASSDSLKLGTVRLMQLFRGASDDIGKFERLIRNHIRSMAYNLGQRFGPEPFPIAIGTGGNFEAILDLKQQLVPRSSSALITAKQINAIFATVIALSPQARVKKLKLKPDRADVIVPALIVVRELLHTFGFRHIRVPGVGLKDGILVEHLRKRPAERSASIAEHAKQVEEFAHALGKRLGFEEEHALQVARLSESLFEQSKRLHRLGTREKILLKAAALLHDVGHVINSSGHHKHSYYIIRNCRFTGLRPEEQRVVACIARYHRKAIPNPSHDFFQELPSRDRSTVQALAALLRIADALDRSHQNKVRALTIVHRGKQVYLRLTYRSPLLNEIWAVDSKKDLFERYFSCRLVLQ